MELLARSRFVSDGRDAWADPKVEVVVEATGNPPAGIAHARAAIAAKNPAAAQALQFAFDFVKRQIGSQQARVPDCLGQHSAETDEQDRSPLSIPASSGYQLKALLAHALHENAFKNQVRPSRVPRGRVPLVRRAAPVT